MGKKDEYLSHEEKICNISPELAITKNSDSFFVSTSKFLIYFHEPNCKNAIGPMWIRSYDQWLYAAENLDIFLNSLKLRLQNTQILEHNEKIIKIRLNYILPILLNRIFPLDLLIEEGKSFFSLSIPEEIISESNKFDLKFKLNINFDKKNAYDYINLSGNLYKSVKTPVKRNFSIPAVGAFSQVWTIHKEDCFIGLFGTKSSHPRHFTANLSKKRVVLVESCSFSALTKPNIKKPWKKRKNKEDDEDYDITVITKIKNHMKEVKEYKERCSKVEKNNFAIFIACGSGDKVTPVKLKFTEIEKIQPLTMKYSSKLEKEAKKSYNTMIEHFLISTPHGKIPANFIFPQDHQGPPFKKMNYSSFGNCFSLGFLTGSNALYKWFEGKRILKVFGKEFLPSIIYGAQITEGPTKGGFFESFTGDKQKWTTGRVQLPKAGFTDWFPNPEDKDSVATTLNVQIPIHELNIGLTYTIALNVFMFKQFIHNFRGMRTTIDQAIVYPAYSGQFAYNIFNIYMDSINNDHYLEEYDSDLENCFDSAAEFLIKYQHKDALWDHELHEDGSVFWKKRTLACIYPATFLYCWGTTTKNEKYISRGLKAIKQCISLLKKGEFYGVYFETNLSINQDDLVTGLACIKCFNTLYNISNDSQYLDWARYSAWHVISYIYGTGVCDKKKNCVTGGLPVTTYKGLGFPVIGGSEVCQAIESLLELSVNDRNFLIYAEAIMGFHSHYLYETTRTYSATHEIIYGLLGNWSTSISPNFASYATGPFLNALYLYNSIIEMDKNQKRKENTDILKKG